MATCEDGLDYCIKHDEGGFPIRANEWIGTWLARAVGLAVAKPVVVQDLNGTLLFGSEIYGDDTNDNLGIFQSGGLNKGHLTHIWKTFAYDLFIRNEDRHVNQYKIFRQNRTERIISFDFGQSLFSFWPNFDLPLPPGSNTILTIRGIFRIYGAIDLGVANEVLQRLEDIQGAAMVTAIRGLPRGWLNRKAGDAFLRWFGSRARRDRITQIREGLRNGTYL